MTGNLTRCPLCLEPVALCSCDELEREVAMAARELADEKVSETMRLFWERYEVVPWPRFACRDPEQAWIKDQQDALLERMPPTSHAGEAISADKEKESLPVRWQP